MKSVVIYTYYSSPSSYYNLSFFVKKELKYLENIDYIIVINGFDDDGIKFPIIDNLVVLKRENKGFDFGGHNAALNYLKENKKVYDYYFFMNSGVIGPILKDDFDKSHWTKLFIEKINDVTKLVGTTIVCLPPDDAGGYGPKVEGFFFMTDKIGLDLLVNEGTIFCDHPDKYSAIVNGEYGLSNCILSNGYSIDCMLQKYQGINWRNSINYNINNHQHPSRKNSYFGTSINPYDVIFHKWYWHGEESVHFNYIQNYVHSQPFQFLL